MVAAETLNPSVEAQVLPVVVVGRKAVPPVVPESGLTGARVSVALPLMLALLWLRESVSAVGCEEDGIITEADFGAAVCFGARL